MRDVLNGTGMDKFVLNAQIIGSSTIKENVCRFQISAILTTEVELVFHVMMAIIWFWENASLLLLKSPQTLVVLPGTGKIKSAFNVLTIG